MRQVAFWLTLVIPALAVICGVWFGNFPLGVPREWEWDRITPTGPISLTFVVPLAAGLLYIGFVWLGVQRIRVCRRAELAAWLGGLCICGFTWLWIAQESAPERYQLSKTVWVLFFRGSSGYYSEAVGPARDLRTYLANYEDKMAEGDVLHIGTHPPGLVIVFRELLDACEALPMVTDFVIATEPDSVRESFAWFQQTARHAKNPLPRPDRAVLWLATLLLQASVVLTIVPLYGLLRRTVSRRASWLAVTFWPTVPALAVFIPKSDCLYPLLAIGFVWLWLTGLSHRSRVLCFLSGMTLWASLVLSLAFLPVLLFTFLATIGNQLWRGGCPAVEPTAKVAHPLHFSVGKKIWQAVRSVFPSAAWAAAGFCVPCIVVLWRLKLNLFAVWWLNFHNHAEFYERYPRTFWKWLLVNPVEFAVAAGIALALLAVWSLLRQIQVRENQTRDEAWAWLLTIGLLWLTCKNMGEVARLWIILMPFLVWIAGPLFDGPVGRPSDTLPRFEQQREFPAWNLLGRRGWMAALALQLVTTAAIVTRVTGFHYP